MKWQSAFLLFLCASLLPSLVYATVHYTHDTYVFTFPSFGTAMAFNADQTFTNACRVSDYWYFTTATISEIAFQVQVASLRVTDYFLTDVAILDFEVTAASGTSTTKIDTGDRGRPADIIGETSWSYDSGTHIATITRSHGVSTPYSITVVWSGGDTTPPFIYSVSYGSTIQGTTGHGYAYIADNVKLSGFRFSTNATGSWVNDTWSYCPKWWVWTGPPIPNLPVAGTVVGFRWYANDTSNNWAISTIYSFVTTAIGENTVVLVSPASENTIYTNAETFTYIPTFWQAIRNASLWTNVTGSWAVTAWNTTTVSNATENSISYTFTSSGTFLWNVAGYNTTHAVFAQANNTLTVLLTPRFSDQSASTNIVNALATYSCLWKDGDGLASYIFSWNATGSWVNGTSTSMTGTEALASVDKINPSTVGLYVSFRFYGTDTDGNQVASDITTIQLSNARPPYSPSIGIRTVSTYTWYMREDFGTVNDVTGYYLNETQTSSMIGMYDSASGNVQCYVGFRVWHVDSQNETWELTDGVPVGLMSRTTSGSGIQSATWIPYGADLNVGWDSLKMGLYIKVGSNPWTLKTTFTSHRLMKKALLNDLWTFQVYTQLIQNGSSYCFVDWGSTSYNSRIEGVTFTDPFPTESMIVDLQNGDFLGFSMFPMTTALGNSLAFGMILLMFCGTIYIRYHSFKPILVLFILFGGGSGIFTLMIPEVGMAIGWLFLVFGLAGLLWQLKR